jgi:nucleoside-diphosphate-sugar epimerase
VEQCQGDVLDPATLDIACKEVGSIVHAAGLVSYWRPRADQVHQVNHKGTTNLLRAAKEAGVKRFLLTSSISTLGWVEDGETGDEDSCYNWGDLPYCSSKRAAEEQVLGAEGIEGLAVNPGIILGAGDINRNGGRMLLRARQEQNRIAPPGHTTLVNLSDAVAGHLLALDKGRAGERYILGGTMASFMEIFSRVAAVVEAPPPSRTARPWQLYLVGALQEIRAGILRREPSFTRDLARLCSRNRQYRSAKAIAELGYQPESIERGIEDCWRWYRDNGVC